MQLGSGLPAQPSADGSPLRRCGRQADDSQLQAVQALTAQAGGLADRLHAALDAWQPSCSEQAVQLDALVQVRAVAPGNASHASSG